MKKKKVIPKSLYPMGIETFRQVGAWELGSLTKNAPDCFNGIVSVRKYRVTVELIDEPIEVIQERIQKLWDENTNMHHWQPLKNAAARYGLELKDRKRG